MDLKQLVASMPRDIVNTILSSNMVPRPLRWRVLKLWGVDTGSVAIEPGAWFGAPHVKLGRDVYLNEGVRFDSNGGITLGDRVRVGSGVRFVSSTHEIGPSWQRCGDFVAAPVVIGDGCWIGGAAVILPGVTIGKGCVIAAGSVVTKDCDADGLYAGIPARRIRNLDTSMG